MVYTYLRGMIETEGNSLSSFIPPIQIGEENLAELYVLCEFE